MPLPYDSQRTDEVLREQVRARIAAGALPRVAPARVFGGYGDDQTCEVCGQSISRTQVQYDVELTGRHDRKSLHFHLACHAAWQLEVS